MSGFGFITRKPKEIKFKIDTKPIHPKDLFLEIYGGLEPLVSFNIKDFEEGKQKRKHMSYGTQESQNKKIEEKQNELRNNWLKTIPKYEIKSEIIFDDTSKLEFDIEPRENFKNSMLKLPSITYLKDQNNNLLILREARSYDIEEALSKIAFQKLKNKFDLESSKQFREHGRKKKAEKPKKTNQVMYIAEPQLLIALENMYKKEKLPRITPNLRILDAKENNMWYIRDFVPAGIDFRINPKAMGKYLGTLHSTGLMEILDRQIIHYAISRHGIINYDPDFMTYSESNTTIRDMQDLKTTIQEENKENSTSYINETKWELIKKQEKETRKQLETKGISKNTIFKYIYRNINLNQMIKTKFIELNYKN